MLHLPAGEWDEAHVGNCAEGLPWPMLDKVRFLGLPGKIDPASIVLETLSPGKIHPTSTEKLSPSQVCLLFTLTTNMGCMLSCLEPFAQGNCEGRCVQEVPCLLKRSCVDPFFIEVDVFSTLW